MSISSKIKQDIPHQIGRFPKLNSGRPYRFHAWKADRNGVDCLYYRFMQSDGQTEQVKKVPLEELEAAVRIFQRKGIFDRKDYEKYCPTAFSSGPCGYAVVGRYLEFRYSAKYQGHGQGFAL